MLLCIIFDVEYQTFLPKLRQGALRMLQLCNAAGPYTTISIARRITALWILPVPHKLLEAYWLDYRSIAWSKWGSIASISSNGTALNLQNLRCDPADGSWSLTEPLPLPRLVESDVPLKHLVWNPLGSDLAVIDSAGRVAILSLFNSLNRPTMSKSCREDPADDLQRVVGCYWLNLAPLTPNRPVCHTNIQIVATNSF